jgi:O-glycosyl hydrolase
MTTVRIRMLIFGSLLGLFLAPPVAAQLDRKAPAGTEFRVHPTKTLQTIDGFGAGFDGKNVPKAFEAIEKPQDRERAYDLLYGDPGARLNVARLTISPNAQPLAHGGGYDWAADEYTQNEWKSLQPVLKRSTPILYAVPFTPPARWKDTGKLTGGGTLRPAHYRDYAEYLVDYLEYRRKTGVAIDVLSVQNEPGMPSPWLSCVWTGEQMAKFLGVLGPMIRAHGLKTRLMMSEGTCWSGAWEHLKPALDDPGASPYVNILASHSYPPNPPNPAGEDVARGRFAAASLKTGAPVWMSEMSLMIPPQPDDPGMKAAIEIANYVHRDLTIGRASVWIYCFSIFTASFRGSMGVLSPADGKGPGHGRLIVPKRLWALANYSHFVRQGWKLVAMEGAGPTSTAFVDPGGQRFAIVAVNAGESPEPVSYAFDGSVPSGVEAFATSSGLDIGSVPPPAVRPGGFATTLPPRSVTTFTGGLGPGPSPPRPPTGAGL